MKTLGLLLLIQSAGSLVVSAEETERGRPPKQTAAVTQKSQPVPPGNRCTEGKTGSELMGRPLTASTGLPSSAPTIQKGFSTETNAAIVGALVGGFIAIVGAWFLAWLQEGRAQSEMKIGIKNELSDLSVRYASLHYLIERYFGNLNRPILEWVRDNSRVSMNVSAKGMESFEQLLAKSDEEIRAMAAALKGAQDGGLSLKPFGVPFIDSQMGRIGGLPVHLQASLLDVRAKIHLVNAEIDRLNFSLETTFTPGIAQVNMERLRQNVQGSYRQISDDSKLIVEKIKNLNEGMV